jgi:hypothetical protein
LYTLALRRWQPDVVKKQHAPRNVALRTL